MLEFKGQDDCTIYRRDGYHEPGFDARDHAVDSVYVWPYTTRSDRVTIWSRGNAAGTLFVQRGDGLEIARKLLN